MIENKAKKLLTIITEETIESRILDDLKHMQIQGYTLWEVHGSGSQGLRSGEWDHDRNVAIQIICSAGKAKEIGTFLVGKYYDDFAMVMFISDVEVFRPEKF